MKFYLRLSLNIFKQNMAYRFEYITKVVALFLTVFAQYYIWRVLLVYQNNTSDVNITEMTTYIIVSTVIGIVLNNRIISEINDQIYTGKIGTELVKPYSYFSLMLARTIGEMLFQLTFFAVPLLIVMYAIFHFSIPDLKSFLLFFCSFAAGGFLRILICFFLGILGFWFSQVWALERLLNDLIKLFSGAWIPLWFFPDYLKRAAEVLPFQYIYFAPISIYIEKYGTAEVLGILGKQLFWIVLFGTVCYLVWKKAIYKIVIQGG